MPRGSSPKREREYEHIKESYEKRGQGKRAEEIAARTVNKQRAEAGETKGSRASAKSKSSGSGKSHSSSGPSRSKSSGSHAGASKGSSRSASRSSASRASSRSSDKPSASRGSSSRSGSSGRTREQLYAEAKRKGIEGRSSMNKAQLERALSR